jgi:hypothetical protein
MNFKEKIKQLKKLPSFEVDELIHTQHEIVFSEINCLDCANCCKTTPALLSQNDINRIAKHLKISNKEFISQYTKTDDDGDTVFKQTPCIFLQQDNTCKIYDIRPFACKDYPHTNRKMQKEILNITEANITICPAVEQIFSNLEI